jgi:vacuolar protein sorting-associated protein 13A/C
MMLQVPGVIRGFLFATASAWSYQPLLAAWEPVLEPWQLLVHVDRNALGHHAVGVAPGLHVKVTSTQVGLDL